MGCKQESSSAEQFFGIHFRVYNPLGDHGGTASANRGLKLFEQEERLWAGER